MTGRLLALYFSFLLVFSAMAQSSEVKLTSINILDVFDIADLPNIEKHISYKQINFDNLDAYDRPLRTFKINFELYNRDSTDQPLYIHNNSIQKIWGYKDKHLNNVIALYLLVDSNNNLIDYFNSILGHYNFASGIGVNMTEEQIEDDTFYWDWKSYTLLLSKSLHSDQGKYNLITISKYRIEEYWYTLADMPLH